MDISNIVIYDIYDAFRVQKKAGDRFVMNGRTTIGLVLVSQGSYIYRQDGKEYLSDKNHVIFLPKGAVYEFTCLKDDDSCIINFSCSLQTTQLFSIAADSAAHMEDYFHEIVRALQKPSGSHRLFCISELYHILSFCRLPEPIPENNKKYAIIEKSVVYMKENFCDVRITNDTAASRSNISAIYYRKVFTGLFGVSPNKYLQGLRLEKAKQLLRLNTMTVEQIAACCGYSSIYYFSSCFKKAEGCTPSMYAQKYNMI